MAESIELTQCTICGEWQRYWPQYVTQSLQKQSCCTSLGFGKK